MSNPAIAQLHAFLEFHLETPALKEACLAVIDHPKFALAFGSSGGHHSYQGGLAVHTLEVARYAAQMAEMMHADIEVCVTAAIFHDFMKIEEYRLVYKELVQGQNHVPGHEFELRKTEFRNLVRHVAGSHAEFVRLIHGSDVPQEKLIKIQHCILGHHGSYEAGSPVVPTILEGHIVHFADMFSAKYGPAKKQML